MARPSARPSAKAGAKAGAHGAGRAGRRPARPPAKAGRTISIGGRSAALLGTLLVLGAVVFAARATGGATPVVRGRLAALVASIRRWEAPMPSPAEVAAMEEDVQAAITAAIDAVEAERTSADAWRDLGMVYGAHALWANAEAAFRRSAQLAPADARTAYYLAYCMAVTVQPVDATAAQFRRAIALEPGYAPTWRGLGEILARGGRLAEAREAYRMAIQAYGTPERAAIAHRELGLVLLGQGDTAGAIAELEAVMRVRADDSVTVRQGQAEKARTASDKAAALQETLVTYDDKQQAMLDRSARRRDIERRIRDQVVVGNSASALEAAKRWEAQHPDWPSIKVLIGEIYGHIGRADDAKRYFDAASRLQELGYNN